MTAVWARPRRAASAVRAATTQPARAVRRARCGGTGGRRRDDTRLEGLEARAHGVKEVAASLTGGLDGWERRRGGGATATSGGRRRGSPVALQGRGRGRIRRGIEGGEGGEASPARNLATAHRRRRIAAAGGARGWWRVCSARALAGEEEEEGNAAEGIRPRARPQIRTHAERGSLARGARMAGGGDACDAPSRTVRRRRRRRG